jgi:predicted dehydrogenase
VALESFDAGKHVFCEKPFAMNTAECDTIIEAAKKAGKQILLFQNHRTNPPFRTLKAILGKEVFGAPVAAVIQYLGCELERMRDATNWKCSYDRAGGGVLLDGGVHVIDLCNWYYGTPVSVLAQLHKPKGWNENKGETTGNLLVAYESGAVAQILASFEALLPGSFSEGTLKVTADLFFENGNAYAEYSYLGKFGMKKATRYVCGSDELHEISPQEMEEVNYHERTLDSLFNGTPPIVTAEEARMAVAVAEAAYESARTGNKAEVSPLP